MMRRYPLIILVLFLLGSGTSWAGGIMINSYRYATPSGLCSSCTPGDPADVLCEDFEGSSDCGNDSGAKANCQCSWSATEDGTGSLNFASTRNQSTNPCANKGTYNVDLNVSGTYNNWDNDYDISKSFTAKTSLYTQAYIYIESEGLSDNQNAVLFTFTDSGSAHEAFVVVLRQVSGALYLATYANDTGTGPNVGGTAISTGTWYRVGMEYVSNTSNGGKIYIAGVEDVGCRINTPDMAVANIYALAGGGTYRWQFDNIQVDDDTMPEACTE